MSILGAVAKFILRIFLSGLFNKVMTQIEMDAQQKMDVAKLQAQSATDAAKVEVDIVKAQARVEKEYSEAAKKPDDPFRNTDWNRGE